MNRQTAGSFPADYPRRVLLVASGLSPQVVTETVYALAIAATVPFVPTEIQLVTTEEGARLVRELLLSDEPVWFSRLRRDYALPEIRFDEASLRVIADPDGRPLTDIQTAADNDAAADFISGVVRELTADPDCALHVSLAGGRKTMGFYLGYALSLFGRPQDRLSHVLVSPPFEADRRFFYPTPQSCVIAERDGRSIDARDARVTLAEIPFVRLRQGLPESLLAGRARFTEVVAAAQTAQAPVALTLDLPGRQVFAAGRVVHLPPAELAFYAWLARRRMQGEAPIPCPGEHDVSVPYGHAYLAEYHRVLGVMGTPEKVEENYRRGMNKREFLQKRSKVNKCLKDALGVAAAPYLVATEGERGRTRYGLAVLPEAIRFASPASATSLRDTDTEAAIG